MLVKFETKSQRVKGLSFHSTRPWILASLHSGEIQLWDYRVGTLLEKYEEHEGPVRGIAFHPNQHLFVSGGDDANIFGWNYKTKKKIFHLKGHLDYVRTVFFHHELPWVISTSDDQTVRIWNYLSRNQLTIMTGHTNLVMCAQFHPSKDLIVSCSLDQTVRLWDYTNLRKKYTSSSTAKPQEGAYTGTEVEIKAIMEGHDRGVNWCAFHPTNNLILSTGDDRKVKLWKYNESTGKAWEHDSLYGHSNNVCCAVFHDKLDVLISNSEDRSIKVWDLNKRVCIDTFKKDADRYWVLALHSDLNYLAAGSDSGLTVFTLQSERIPFVVTNNTTDIFYVYKKQLMHRDVKSGRETTITNIDHSPSNPSLKFQKPSSITYNHFNNASHNVLVQFKDQERNYYKYFLYTFNNNVDKGKDSVDSTHRYCIAATFVSKDKLAVLTTGKELGLVENNGNIRNLPNLPPIDMIFPAYMGKIILQNDYIAMLYDTISRKIVNQIEHTDISKLKHVVWNSKFTYVALLCKKTIFILNKNFQLVGTVEEKFKVMSAAWNNDEVLIYTTQNHLKYSIINGDNGILKCIESPFYIVAVKDNEALTIDRDAKVQSVLFDREEYLFKASLFYKDAKRIKFLMENHKQLGNSIISYLYKKNYPAIALNMVKDTRARFSLALDSGNLEVAFRACYDQLKDKECFAKLGEEALRQGNHQIVEISYQNTKAYERLAFLYLVIGNMNKLEMMSQLAQKREDIMGRFHISLFLGDISERIRILAEVGLLHLAYLTAVTHNVGEMVEPLYESLKDNLPEFELPETPIALIPPKPIILNPKSTPVALCNWPHHQLEEEDILWSGEAQENEDQPAPAPQQELELNLDTRGNAYEEEPQPVDFNAAHKELESPMDANWGEDIDIIDIPDIIAPAANAGQDTFKDIADSAPGKDPILEKARNSQLAGELVACGEFDAALSILKKQIGVVETGPYASIFEKLHNSSRVKISGLPFTSPVEILLSEDGKKPYVLGSIAQLTGLLRAAYRLTTEGKFAEALVGFQNVLLHIPLLVLKKAQEEEDVYALIRICYHYILAMKCELSKKQYANDPVRCLELSAYMACCSLQAAHRILTLRSAMSLAYKMQDFIYAAFFAKKIIQIAETNPNVTKPEVVDNAKKVYAVCEQKGSNVHTIEFDPTWLNDDNVVTSRLCAKSLKVIKGGEVKRDSFVKAAYSPQFDGQLDEISGVCKIGMECLGLKMH